MKSMFERGALDEVVRCIESLHAGSQHVWGKMDVARMLLIGSLFLCQFGV